MMLAILEFAAIPLDLQSNAPEYQKLLFSPMGGTRLYRCFTRLGSDSIGVFRMAELSIVCNENQGIQKMPNLASVLKQELVRISRRELRAETRKLKSASSQYRSDIAALKRRIQALEQQIRNLAKRSTSTASVKTAAKVDSGLRFSAKGLAAQRRRLGLSAADVAALLGVSAQSIYKWEDGKARPRASQLPAIASLRGMGKRQALAKLEAMA
jgi:DNA-binding transcriptional regulator YiaG